MPWCPIPIPTWYDSLARRTRSRTVAYRSTERGGPLAVLPSQLPVLCRRHLLTAFAWVGLYGELY